MNLAFRRELEMARRTISIAMAAMRLRLSYNQVQRRVLIGELKGEQGEDGRWSVDERDVERYARERDRAATA